MWCPSGALIAAAYACFAPQILDRGIQIHDWPQSVSMSQDKLQTIFVNAANMPSGEKARNLADPNVRTSLYA